MKTTPVALVFLAAAILVPLASAQSTSSNQHIQHILQGGGWSTAFHIFNLCSSASKFTVRLRGDDGESKEFYFREGLWPGFRRESFNGNGIAFLYFPNTEEARSGYGEIIEDGDGCVVIDTFHVQHHDDEQTLYVVSSSQRLSSTGVVLPFLNFEGCDSSVSIVSNGGTVGVEVFDTGSMNLGQANLGNMFHTSFMLSEMFPMTVGKYGTARISGNVGALGLQICEGNLLRARMARPAETPSLAGATSELYEIVSFEAKHIGFGVFDGKEYAYRLTIRNPTQSDQAYEVDLLLRDSDGFVVDRTPVTGACNGFDFDCASESFRVPSGQTRTFENTASFSVSYNSLQNATVDVEIVDRD